MNPLKLLLLIFGLNTSFLYWGILQERITTSEFDMSFELDGNATILPYQFKNIFFLNALQCLVCASVAFLILFTKYFFGVVIKRKEASFSRNVAKNRPRQYPSMRTFVNLGFSYAMGPSIGLLSLRFISYPLYLLIKTSKLIPNMCIGYFFYGHRYERKRIFAALMITVGLVLFTVSENKKGSYDMNIVQFFSTFDTQDWRRWFAEVFIQDPVGITAHYLRYLHDKLILEKDNLKTIAGVSLVVANLCIDAFTASTQDELVMKYKFNSIQLMFLTNCFACLVLVSVCVGSEVFFAMPNIVSIDGVTTGLTSMSNVFWQGIIALRSQLQYESFGVFMASVYVCMLRICADLADALRRNTSPSRVIPVIQSAQASASWVPPQLYTSLFALSASMEFRRTVLAYLLCGVSGQLFLFIIQNTAGSLFLVSVTMIRKVLSILITLVTAHLTVSSLQQTGPVVDSKKMFALSLIIVGISMEFFSTVYRKSKKA